MPKFIFRDPETGRSWTVKSPSTQQAQDFFAQHQQKLGAGSATRLETEPREPSEAPSSAQIKLSPQGEAEFPETTFPGLEQRGEPTNSLGPTEAGKKRLAGKTPLEQLDIWASSIAPQTISSLTMGLGPAVASRLGNPNWDETLAQAREITGEGGEQLNNIATSLVNPLNRYLPSGRIGGAGLIPAAKRVGLATAEVGTAAAADAALRGENSPIGAAAETLPTSASIGALIEFALGLKGKGAKRLGQRGMSEADKAREAATPEVQSWIDQMPPPDQPLPQDATVRDILGPASGPEARGLSGQAPGPFEALRKTAQKRQDEALDRVRETVNQQAGRPLSSSQAQEQGYRDIRHEEDPKYTPVLQGTVPLTSIGMKGKKDGPAVFPRPFRDVLKDPDLFKIWQDYFQKGTEQAKSQAALGKRQPGQLEAVWETVKLLEKNDATSALGKALKDRLRGQNKDLDELITAQARSGAQERGAKLGAQLLSNPAKIDTHDMDVALSTPEGKQAVADSFLASFTDRFEQDKKPPVMTDKLREVSVKLIGPEKTAALEARLNEEARSNRVDKSVLKEGDIPLSREPDPSRLGKALKGAARILSGGIIGGPIGAAAQVGPGLAYLTKTAAKKRSPSEASGILQLFNIPVAKLEDGKKIPTRKRNPLETTFEKSRPTTAYLASENASEKDRLRVQRREQRRKGG